MFLNIFRICFFFGGGLFFTLVLGIRMHIYLGLPANLIQEPHVLLKKVYPESSVTPTRHIGIPLEHSSWESAIGDGNLKSDIVLGT